ncbi:MAG: hypothetical protein ACI9U2_001322 [Bradymonadia bacterium]|jgi:hypothetical protein
MYQRRYTQSAAAAAKPYRFRRLSGRFDPAPLLGEIDALPDDAWLDSQWKWHLGTRFCILRGGPAGAARGARLTGGGGVDAPVLDAVPHLRRLLDTAFPVPAVLAWVGVSPPGARIHVHVDNTAHWDEHHRIHLPLRTQSAAKLCVAGRWLHLAPGKFWALNNSLPHAAANDGPVRLHLMVDLPDVPAVRDWIADGADVDGERDAELWADVARDPFDAVTPDHLKVPGLLGRLLQQ